VRRFLPARAVPKWRASGFFPRAGEGAGAPRGTKNPPVPPSSSSFRPRAGARFSVVTACQERNAEKAARVAVKNANKRKDLTMSSHTRPPQHSVTAAVIAEMQLYGYRPHDEPDPRPLPDAQTAQAALIDIFDAVVSTFADTRLEPDVEELLWSVVNLFHRARHRAQRRLDDNEDLQHLSQAEQDGSEVRSVELERLTAEGISLIEKRNTFDVLTDLAAELFEQHTGSAWRPLAGSKVNHKTMTAALIDSRDFLSAKRRAETEIMLPQGTRIAFSGGIECNDHQRIWDALDKTLARYPDMVLLHGATPKGAERIAACWAESRKVTQIAFKPDWAKHAKAAPFRRNDQLLATMPKGVIIFPGSGITGNLADKARKLGIPVWRFDTAA
jgi:hypothetical protein